MEYASALRTMSNSFASADCMAAEAMAGETRGGGMMAGEMRGAAMKGAKMMNAEMMAGETKAGKARGAKADCCHKKEKPGAHQCNTTNDCCLSCPLCYVMLATDPQEPMAVARVAPDYVVWTSSYLYLHHGDCWKPPNAA